MKMPSDSSWANSSSNVAHCGTVAAFHELTPSDKFTVVIGLENVLRFS